VSDRIEYEEVLTRGCSLTFARKGLCTENRDGNGSRSEYRSTKEGQVASNISAEEQSIRSKIGTIKPYLKGGNRRVRVSGMGGLVKSNRGCGKIG
jgi:hypothetical protein